ncbi:MAG: hypothetical protein JO176_02975, partial [Acidimicrobiia bacterium]|nr:hypothetical protein [Acidimicrobiia bacterium]
MLDRPAWNRVLRTAAIALVLSTVLAIAGQVIYVLSFPGGRFPDRLDFVSEIANPTLGVLVVGAVVLLLAARRSNGADADTTDIDAVAVAVVVLGAVLVIATVYSVVRLVSIHVPSPGATGQGLTFRLNLQRGDWSTRIGQILLRAAGGVLGAWAAWVALTTMVLADAPT